MGAELGQTNDPRDLIPGDPQSITEDLRELVNNLRRIEAVTEMLRGVNPRQWVGEAADEFRAVFGAEPVKWEQVAASAGNGANALADFGDVLTWGQQEAQRAIDMFTQAQAASRAAAAQYNAQAQSAAAAGQTMAPFSDPGTAAAQEAQRILDAARNKVGEVGDSVARALGFEQNDDGTHTKSIDGPEGFRGKTKDFKYGDDKEDGNKDEKDKSKNGKNDKKKPGMLGDKLGIGTTITSGSASAGTDVDDGSVRGTFDKDGIDASGEADGSVLGADASAQGSVGRLGVSGSADADAYLAKGDADGQAKLGKDVTLKGDVQGEVGADADAQGQIGATGVSGGLGAFAGGKISGDASAEAGGVTAGVHGEAWAGVGAEASGQFGMGTDGKFHIGASLGLALGVGGKAGFDFSFDPKQVENTVKAAATDIGNVASEAGNAIANTASTFGHDITSIGSKALGWLDDL